MQVKNSLGIRVIDHDRADDVRDTTSLSGGETFIVSLGLALGLSALSSRNLSFENLFIDEGFGTLDPDTLSTVIDALAMLQSSQGKKVGVISHTDTMSERITTRYASSRTATREAATSRSTHNNSSNHQNHSSTEQSSMSRELAFTILTAAGLCLYGCQNNRSTEESAPEEPKVVFPADTASAYVAPASKTDSLKTLKGKMDEDFNVLKEMENNAPEYYERLQRQMCHGFIVIDKSRMKLILYDKEGGVVRRFAMGCSTKFGTKHKKGDNRTPEGFFTVENVYNSTDWLYTDDEGRLRRRKGCSDRGLSDCACRGRRRLAFTAPVRPGRWEARQPWLYKVDQRRHHHTQRPGDAGHARHHHTREEGPGAKTMPNGW